MTSRENSGLNINNSPCPDQSSSQTVLLSEKFKINLNKKLDEKIASLEAEMKEVKVRDEAFAADMKLRCDKLKETKKKIKESKKRVEELKKTRDNIWAVERDLTEYDRLLKSGLKKYQDDNIEMKEEHEASIEEMGNKWKIYEARYEKLPWAVARNEEKALLEKAKIELMLKQVMYAKLKEAVAVKDEIETKRRNSLAVDLAELYKVSEFQDIKLRETLETQEKLRAKIQEQEKTLSELEKKRNEEMIASQKFSVKKSSTSRSRIAALITSSQKYPRLQLPHFDLPVRSTNLTSLSQPMPTFCRYDSDAMSITSSIIDNLIETTNPPLMETEEGGLTINSNQEQVRSQDNRDDRTENGVGYHISGEQNNKDENLNSEGSPLQNSSKDQKKEKLSAPRVRFEKIKIREEQEKEIEQRGEGGENPLEKFQGVYDRDDSLDRNSQLKITKRGLQNFSSRKYAEEVDAERYGGEGGGEKEQEKIEEAESEYPATPVSYGFLVPEEKSHLIQREGSNTTQKTPQPNIKRPKITNIENVRILHNVASIVTPKPITPRQPTRDDSLAGYFANSFNPASSLDYSWRNRNNVPANLNFTITESQKGNAELESILDSESSLQSEDMFKKLHYSFSPDRCKNSNTDKDQLYPSTSFDNYPRADFTAPTTTAAASTTPQQFLDMRENHQGTPAINRGNKMDTFFLSMF